MLLPASHHTVANPRRHCVRNVNKRPDVTGMVWNLRTEIGCCNVQALPNLHVPFFTNICNLRPDPIREPHQMMCYTFPRLRDTLWHAPTQNMLNMVTLQKTHRTYAPAITSSKRNT